MPWDPNEVDRQFFGDNSAPFGRPPVDFDAIDRAFFGETQAAPIPQPAPAGPEETPWYRKLLGRDSQTNVTQGLIGQEAQKLGNWGLNLYGAQRALKGGVSDMLSSLGATSAVWQGDQEAAQRLGAQQGDKTPQQQAFARDLEAAKVARGDETFAQAAANLGQAVWQNPTGAFQEGVAQTANMAPAVGGMVLGAKLGALAFPPLPLLGGVVGGAIGGVLGAIGVETGGYVKEDVAKGQALNPEEMDRIKTAGAIKGTVTGAADLLTLGINRWMMGIPGRAANRAAIGALSDLGVDVADKAAVEMALRVPTLRDAAASAATRALEPYAAGWRGVGLGATGLGIEMFGEGAGEYGGTLAAGNEPSPTEALLEAWMSFGQSATELLGARKHAQQAQRGFQLAAAQRPESGGAWEAPSGERLGADRAAGGTPPAAGVNLGDPFARADAAIGIGGVGGTPAQAATPPGGSYGLFGGMGDAQQVRQAGAVHGDVRSGAGEIGGQGAVPTAQGGAGVPAGGPAGPSAAGGGPGPVAIGTAPEASRPYLGMIQSAAARYGVPADLLAAVAEQESSWNPKAVSSAGAKGMMQFKPDTARRFGVEDPHNPAEAIPAAARYLSTLYDEFGNWDLALAGYNAGEGAVRKHGNQIPPYRETQDYVASVNRRRQRYGGIPDQNGQTGLDLRPGLDFNRTTGEISGYEAPAFEPDTYADIDHAGSSWLHDLMAEAESLGVNLDSVGAWAEELGGEVPYANLANEIQRRIDEANYANRQALQRQAYDFSERDTGTAGQGAAVPQAPPPGATPVAQPPAAPGGPPADQGVVISAATPAPAPSPPPVDIVPMPPQPPSGKGVPGGKPKEEAAGIPAAPEFVDVPTLGGATVRVRSAELNNAGRKTLRTYSADGAPGARIARDKLAAPGAAATPESGPTPILAPPAGVGPAESAQGAATGAATAASIRARIEDWLVQDREVGNVIRQRANDPETVDLLVADRGKEAIGELLSRDITDRAVAIGPESDKLFAAWDDIAKKWETARGGVPRDEWAPEVRAVVDRVRERVLGKTEGQAPPAATRAGPQGPGDNPLEITKGATLDDIRSALDAGRAVRAPIGYQPGTELNWVFMKPDGAWFIAQQDEGSKRGPYQFGGLAPWKEKWDKQTAIEQVVSHLEWQVQKATPAVAPETPIQAEPTLPPAVPTQPPAETPPAVSTHPPKGYGEGNKVFTADAAAAARELLRKKLGQLSAGIDPELMHAGVILAGYHIEAGARAFGDYAKAMISDIGEAARPYLRSWYEGVRHWPGFDATGMTPAADLDAAQTPAEPPTIKVEGEDIAREPNTERTPTGEAGTAGVRPSGQGGRGGRRPAGGANDRGLAPEQPENGGAPGEAGDTGGTGPRDLSPAERDRNPIPEGGNGLAGQPGGGVSGLGVRAGGGERTPGGRTGGRRGPKATDRTGAKPPGGAASEGGGQENQAGAEPQPPLEAPPETPPGQKPRPEYVRTPGQNQAQTLEARAENFHAEDPERIYGGTPKKRFAKNRRAIEIYRDIQESERSPTPEEREALASYTGWGSFGQELFHGTWERAIYKDGWREENDWLRQHLGEKEWRSAADSIRNAHYTDPYIVQAMWSMVERVGFRGGRVLEPSAGIGNFYALMPKHLKDASRLAAIELDDLSAGMLRLLYPNANVQHKGYQDSHTPDGFYDLVIGNWPFDRIGPADRRYNTLSPTLHDYFFLKSLDQVRPGGLVVGITSRYSMDSEGRAVRLAMAKKAELVAAIRLPSGAFEEYAGTAVVTDILILKRREKELADASGEPWVDAPKMPLGSEGQEAAINQYYHDNPGQVLGTMDWGHGTTYGRSGVIVNRPADLRERLQALAERLPENIYEPATQTKHLHYITNNTQERTRAVTIGEDGQLYQVQGDNLALLNDVKTYQIQNKRTTATREAQLRALVGMRRAYGQLIDAERFGAENTEALRAELRGQYEAFVGTHGALRSSYGLKFLRDVEDPFYPSLAALERERDGVYEPMPILSRPVLRTPQRLENPTVREAYVLERNRGIDVRMSAIAAQAGVSEDQAEQELIESGALYRTPGGGYEPADMYLSGNVRRKLREAKAAAEQGEDMERNIRDLEAAIPPTVPYFNIEAKLGAQWVEQRWYRQFLAEELIGDPDAEQRLEIEWRLNRWVATFDDNDVTTATAMRWRDVIAYKEREDGTMYQADQKVVTLRKLVEAAFNNGTMLFTGKNQDGSVYVREELNAAANERAMAIREAFDDWVWRDPERKLALERDYNEVMNAIANTRFDGSFLSFVGMALQRGEAEFNLRKHQVNAIWRALVERSGLYAHEVGTGKTYTMAGIAVESRRFGIARKPLILAHNANSAQVATEIQEMYPGAKVLYVNNLKPKRVKETLYQIRNDDWDAVVMPHSLLDRLVLSKEQLEALAAEEIAALEQAFWDALAEDSKSAPRSFDFDDEDEIKKVQSPTAKELAMARLKIKQRINKMAQAASRPDAVTFDDLGVDMLLVDEAHLFKKPPMATRMKMRGLNKGLSDRSVALKFLVDYVKGQNAGKGVHLFTGTPITNTLSEIFHMQRYVAQQTMRDDGISYWDAWFNTFATGVSDVEFTAAGEYEPITRLAGFINVAELRRMMSPYMDVVFADDMPEFKPRATKDGKTMGDKLTDDERLELLNGRSEDPIGRPYKKVVIDVAEMSPEQEAILAHLQLLAKEWKDASKFQRKQWMKAKDDHVPLHIDGVAARAGIDARMEDMTLPEYANSKVNRAVRNIMHHYLTEAESTQVVFADKGYSDTREVKGETVPGHNLIKELVSKLVAAGIPQQEIAVVAGGVTPERKQEIANAVNEGKIRVVIGQTETLGTGVNMQRRLRAMHHLDAPWMPGDLEQRNGRGWRQGNTWNTVFEYRYVTERIDGKRWQVLSVKDRFIKAFLKADESVRVIEGDAVSEDEEDSFAATLSEAVGDPRVLLRQKLKQDVDKLRRKERVHAQAMVEARDKLRNFARNTEKWQYEHKVRSADNSDYVDARDAAEEAQHAAHRQAVRDYVEGLGLGLSTAQLDSVRDHGWGPKQPDRELAKRVQQAVKTAEELGRKRPEEPTTVAVDAVLNGKRYTNFSDFNQAIDDYAKAHAGDETYVWTNVGSLYGFEMRAARLPLQSRPTFRLVSRADPEVFYDAREANAQSVVGILRDMRRHAANAKFFLDQAQLERKNLERVANMPFARQKDLDRKAARLKEIEADMERNPNPAPPWLRHGAPVDTAVKVGGKEYVVEGHQWLADGYFVLVTDGERSQAVPYLDVTASDGMPLFDPVAFKAPPKVGKFEAGVYLVTLPDGKPEPSPRFLTDADIEQLSAHGYRLTPAAAPDPAPGGQGGTPRFSMGPTGGQQGMPVASVEAIAAEILDKTGLGRGGMRARVAPTESALPPEILASARKEGALGSLRAVIWENAMWLVADQMSGRADIEDAFAHETAHYGLRRLMGSRAVLYSNRLYALVGEDAGIRRLAETHGFDMEAYFATADSDAYRNNPIDRNFLLADELLAHLEQHGPRSLPERIVRALQELVGAIRAWLRNHGFAELAKFSDADLFYQLRRIREAARAPAAAPSGGGAMRFVRTGDQRLGPRTATEKAVRLRRGIDTLVEDAKSAADGRNWYDRHVDILVDLFGDDAEMMRALLAITSQGVNVATNVMLAMRAYEQIKLDLPFEGVGLARRNLERYRAGEPVGGLKIGAFSKALAGDQDAIAVDRHIARYLFGVTEPSPAQYRKAEQTIRTVARKLGWTPRETQAALWTKSILTSSKDNRVRLNDYAEELPRRTEQLRALRERVARSDYESGRSQGGVAAEAEATSAGRGEAATGRGEGNLIRFSRAPGQGQPQANPYAQQGAVAPTSVTLEGVGEAVRGQQQAAESAVRESMRTGVPPGPSPRGETPGAARQRLRDWLTGTLNDEKGGGLLGGFSLRQLADVGDKYLPQLKLLVKGMQQFQTARNGMFKDATARVKEWRQFGRAEAGRLAQLMHESTIAQWDPSKENGGAPPFDAKEAKRRIRQINRMEAELPGERGERWNEWRAERDDLLAKIRLQAYRERHRARIEALWEALSPGAQRFYEGVRDDYAALSNRMEEAIVARIEAAELAEEVRKQAILQVRQEFEQARLAGPYFPLQRFGRYYAVLTRPTGKTYQDKRTGEEREELERAFLLFETPALRRSYLAEARSDGWTVVKQGVNASKTGAMDSVSEGFVADAVAQFRAKLGRYEGDKAAEVLYQSFLATMPYLSHRLHFITRSKTAGYSEDALRAYAFNSAHLANQIARQEQLPLWEGAMRDAERHVKDVQENAPEGDATWSESFLNEARARFDWLMNPEGSSWASMANALGFVWYLGWTPATALVNLTQIPMIALPELGSHYGFVEAERVLRKTMGQVLHARRLLTRRTDYGAWNLTDEDRALMRWCDEAGVFQNTQVGMLMGMAETDSTRYKPAWTRAMEIIGFLFQEAEVINREGTALAAYRLERARNPNGSQQEARERAADLVWTTHFDYTNLNRARILQGNNARVLLQFKSYAQHLSYYLGRNLWQATKDESPDVRREARKRLYGVLGMTTLLAGSAGLPFALKWALMGTFGLVALLFSGGDEGDEPWDTETEWRSFLAKAGWFGRVADRGLVNSVLGVDLSSRVGLDQLWLRDPDRDLNGKDTWHHYIEQLLGPVVGIGASAFKAADLMAEGNVERGVEAMLPKAVRDLLRAGRYAVEGVQTTKGDEVVPREEVGPLDIAMQAMGFTPDEIRRQWDTNAMRKDYERYKIDRRRALIGAFALARAEDDSDALERAREAIRAFNDHRASGEKPITPDDLRESIRTRARYRAQSQGGIYIQPQYRPSLERIGAP